MALPGVVVVVVVVAAGDRHSFDEGARPLAQQGRQEDGAQGRCAGQPQGGRSFVVVGRGESGGAPFRQGGVRQEAEADGPQGHQRGEAQRDTTPVQLREHAEGGDVGGGTRQQQGDGRSR